jgi:hypothetical protein
MPECHWCRGGIIFKTGPDGKSHAFNLDDTPHRCKKPEQGIIARVTAYDVSNIYLGGKLSFLPSEIRKSTQENHPVGTVVKAIIEKGTCKSMEKAAGADLEKFLKDEAAKRTEPKATTPAAAPPQTQQPKQEPCTSPAAAPVQKTKEPKKDEWGDERERFLGLLNSTDREGIPALLQYLIEKTDFFIAPSSTKYHDARDGGLLHHSLKVYDNLVALSKMFAVDVSPESLTIIALLHDVCKVNFYKMTKKALPRKDEKGELVLDDFGRKIWDETLVYDIVDQFPLGHGEKSVILIQHYIKLTDEEIMGIRWHMMAYDDVKNSYAGNLAITNASDKYRIIPLVHMADLAASFLEVREGA